MGMGWLNAQIRQVPIVKDKDVLERREQVQWLYDEKVKEKLIEDIVNTK
jgi:hypothetical protein